MATLPKCSARWPRFVVLPDCFYAAGLATGTFIEILDKDNATNALVDAATAKAAGLAKTNRSEITNLCAALPITTRAHAGMQVHIRVDASWQDAGKKASKGEDAPAEPFYVAGVLVSLDVESTGQTKKKAAPASTMLITSLALEANQAEPRSDDFVFQWQGLHSPSLFKAADKVLLQEIEQTCLSLQVGQSASAHGDFVRVPTERVYPVLGEPAEDFAAGAAYWSAATKLRLKQQGPHFDWIGRLVPGDGDEGYWFQFDNATDKFIVVTAQVAASLLLEPSFDHYRPGQVLMVVHTAATGAEPLDVAQRHVWRRATVVESCAPSRFIVQPTLAMSTALGDGGGAAASSACEHTVEVDLNTASHFIPCIDTVVEFTGLLQGHLSRLAAATTHVYDGLTGKQRTVAEQMVALTLTDTRTPFEDQPCFTPDATHKACFARLACMPAGSFFVRKSSSVENAFTIDWKPKGAHVRESVAKSVRVLPGPDGGYVVGAHTYATIEEYCIADSRFQYPLGIADLEKYGGVDRSNTLAASPPGLAHITHFADVADAKGLAAALGSAQAFPRAHGHQAQCLLVRAPAGSGKTWLTQQVVHMMCTNALDRLSGSEVAAGGAPDVYVPYLVTMSTLANLWRRKLAAGIDPGDQCGGDVLEWFIRATHGNKPKEIALLLDLYHSQRLVLILDGLDEAVDLWSAIKKFVVEAMALGGHRCVLTTRPEGVAVLEPETWKSFAVFTLQPYSPEQQRAVLENQLSGSTKEFVEAVLNFSAAEHEMDVLHGQVDEAQADALFALPELCAQADMCQVTRDPGTDAIRPVASYAELAAMVQRASLAMDAVVQELAEKMGVAVTRTKANFAAQGYQGFLIASPKTQESIERKAARKYQPDIDAGKRPGSRYAWVFDAVRMSLAMQDSLLDALAALSCCDSIELVRVKNYFAHLDPTHLRRLGVTVKLDIGDGLHHLCEVQLMHSRVFEFKAERRDLMHRPYETLRGIFGASINSQLDSTTGWMALTDRIQQWSVFIQEPVLMSLLVAVLDDFDFEDPRIELLPKVRADLYSKAIQGIAARRARAAAQGGEQEQAATTLAPMLLAGLRKVAFANHFGSAEGRRIFTGSDVQATLARAPAPEQQHMASALVACFAADLSNAYRVPTLRILEEGRPGSSTATDAGNGPGVAHLADWALSSVTLQSVHLSLQEFLAAEQLCAALQQDDGGSLESERAMLSMSTGEEVLALLQNQRHAVLLGMAAELRCAHHLFARWASNSGCINLAGQSPRVAALLVKMLAAVDSPTAALGEQLSLSGNGLTGRDLESFAPGLRVNPQLRGLDVSGNELRGLAAAGAFDALFGTPDCMVERLDVSRNASLGAAVGGLLAYVPQSRLTELSLAGCGLPTPAAQTLAELVSDPSCRLVALDVSDNPSGGPGSPSVVAIADALGSNRSLRRVNMNDMAGVTDADGALAAIASLTERNRGITHFAMRGTRLVAAMRLRACGATGKIAGLAAKRTGGGKLPGGKGAEAVCKMLCKMATQNIVLAECNFGGIGLPGRLADSIKSAWARAPQPPPRGPRDPGSMLLHPPRSVFELRGAEFGHANGFYRLRARKDHPHATRVAAGTLSYIKIDNDGPLHDTDGHGHRIHVGQRDTLHETADPTARGYQGFLTPAEAEQRQEPISSGRDRKQPIQSWFEVDGDTVTWGQRDTGMDLYGGEDLGPPPTPSNRYWAVYEDVAPYTLISAASQLTPRALVNLEALRPFQRTLATNAGETSQLPLAGWSNGVTIEML